MSRTLPVGAAAALFGGVLFVAVALGVGTADVAKAANYTLTRACTTLGCGGPVSYSDFGGGFNITSRTGTGYIVGANEWRVTFRDFQLVGGAWQVVRASSSALQTSNNTITHGTDQLVNSISSVHVRLRHHYD
ncbi:MAG: hypothetical protein GEU28_13835, partial [Dehalococcoidia bacterium]|nr:hypothetical protein [Dehalococcoidia bacterium]